MKEYRLYLYILWFVDLVSKILKLTMNFNSLEMWSFELIVLLSGLLPNPELETSVLSIRLVTNCDDLFLIVCSFFLFLFYPPTLPCFTSCAFQPQYSSNGLDDPFRTQFCCEVSCVPKMHSKFYSLQAFISLYILYDLQHSSLKWIGSRASKNSTVISMCRLGHGHYRRFIGGISPNTNTQLLGIRL